MNRFALKLILCLSVSVGTLSFAQAQQTAGKQLQSGAAATNLGVPSFARQGNTSTFATTSGAYTTGNCIKSDASGNFIDAGSACGTGGGGSGTVNAGTLNQLAYYGSAGTTISGLSLGTNVFTALGNATNGNSGLLQLNGSGAITIGTLQNSAVTQTNAGTLSFAIKDSTQALDTKIWDMQSASGVFKLRAVKDDLSAATSAFEITRSGTTISKLTVPNTIVGIGTSTPDFALTIVNSSNQALHIRSSDVDIGWSFTSDVSNGRLIVGEPTVGERFTILTNGSVGINNNNPSYTLDVNGTVNATAFRGSLANATGLPLSTGVTGTLQAAQEPAHTGDVTNTAGSLAMTVGSIGGKSVSLAGSLTTTGAFSLGFTLTGATSVTLPTSGTLATVGGNLGTPSAITLTNATGLPIAGITGLGTGVGTALANATNGIGGLVTYSGAFGTPSSITLTNASGLPIAGITGLGTGVNTTLGAAVTGTGGIVLASAPTIASPTFTTAFTATGLVKNTDLVNASTTVNGVTCTLGATCSITATAASITVGTTTVLTGSNGYFLYNNAGTLGNVASTGSGSVVLATSPTLTTPNLGTPSALTLTNATGLPIAGIAGLGVGVGTALANATNAASGLVTFSGAFGTPTSLTLTNATGLPIAGITGLGTGVGTALANATNATGGFTTFSGSFGTPTSLTLTNATGLPIAGITGLGTGVGTALANAVNGASGIAVLDASNNLTATAFNAPTLSATNGSGAATINIVRPSGSAGNLWFKSGSSNRWVWSVTATAESGSNVGSNLGLNAYDDTGAYLSTPILITRSSGLVTIPTLNLSSLPGTAGAGGVYLCVDSSGTIYKKASCP